VENKLNPTPIPSSSKTECELCCHRKASNLYNFKVLKSLPISGRKPKYI
jgi:hypothetical protein